MNGNDLLDNLINILKRVKNCDKALNNLEMALDNLLFKGEIDKLKIDDIERYRRHVLFLITESVRLIKDVENEK